MTLFFVIAAWAFLEALQDPDPSPRLISPAILFSWVREITEIFLLTVLGAGILSAAGRHMAGAQDYLTASMMMLFYLYGRMLNRRPSFTGMAFACAVFFSRENSLALIAARSAVTAVGVTFLRAVLKGVQKRRFLNPVPVWMEGLPAFLVTAAVISLIGSVFFVR